MLPKNRRISRKLFKEIISQKKRFSSQNFSLQVASNDKARFAVSVSKKISKKAVVRNKIRRRVYSVIGEFMSETKPGFYLIIAKPGAQEIKGEKLRNELKKLLVVSY